MGQIVLVAPPGYLRSSFVAVVMGVTPRTVRRWVKENRLSGRLCYGVLLVEEASYELFLRQGYSKRGKKPWQKVEKMLAEIFPQGLDL